MARPSKLTPEIKEKILSAIRAGNYIETAAAYAGVSKTTLYDWLKRGARERERLENEPKARPRKSESAFMEFSNAVEKALAEAEVRDVAIIAKAAHENWQAAAWRLERKFPTRWGRRLELGGEIGVREEREYHYIHEILADPDALQLAHALADRLAIDPGDARPAPERR